MEQVDNLDKQTIMSVLALMVSVLIVKYFLVGGVKPIIEYHNLGLIRFVFQYIYYFFEVILILLTIAFSQKYFEIINNNQNRLVPYGGLFLACTWGLAHIMTWDLMTGIYAFIVSVIYGGIYLLLDKSTKYSYIAILILFIM